MLDKTVTKLRIVNVVACLIGFSQALATYLNSSFLKEKTGSDNVGLFYVLAYLLVLAGLLNFHKLIRKIGKAQTLWLVAIGEVVALGLLLAFMGSWFSLIGLILYLLFDALIGVSMDIVLESLSDEKNIGRIRGSYLTLWNIGFIFGPKISSLLMDASGKYGYYAVFGLIFILKAFVLYILIRYLGKVKNGKLPQQEKVFELFHKFWHHRNLRRIYYVSFVLEFFYGLMIVYTPIYLRELGFSWVEVGSIFFIMLLPFLFFEYPIGWLADKKWGEREMAFFFLTWLGFFTAILYFFEVKNFWLWTIGLLITRIGAASVQILRDSYFYKRIAEGDFDLIDVFRTAQPVGYIMAALVSGFLLQWVDLKTLFLVNAIVVFSALFPTYFLLDNLSEEEKMRRV